MKHAKQTRAPWILLACLAAIALCIVAAVALLQPNTNPKNIEIPGTRGNIPATIQLPAKSARGEELPLVVLCHGFTGNRQGDGHFAPLAEDLAAHGIATVRLDFAGCGDSTEPYANYTLANMAADVDSVIGYMQATYGTGKTALVGHSMGGRLASLYPQLGQYPVTALALWSPANGTGLQGLEFLSIDNFAAVEELAARADAEGSVAAWGVELSAAYIDGMRDSDPNATLQESGLPVLLTYSGNERILSDTTQTETKAAVESLPDGQVVLDPFVNGDHNYTSEDPATNTQLDADLRQVTVDFLTSHLQ
ncbi:alpha/beta hydrolase [uncultured Gemmiger sp.]|jgi:pimeloyl-ACP methyl ester carboxylesterase|uniref:alpha/beta hydrolase n=1 Tax=uncultured Gemmiger sp. TaxID=1623490 RepID=UPI002803A041|nr:alpha/beta hydrolase [uncultured Gemmiger sp.]